MKNSLTSTSKFLSLVLRHKPETIGIAVRKFDAADITYEWSDHGLHFGHGKQLESLIGSDGDELLVLLRNVVESVAKSESTKDYAVSLKLERGVTGYTYHTVPVVIHAWLSHPCDYRAAVTSVIECGGDADTTAAIVGGIVGTSTGVSGIPEKWISGIREWPRSVGWMRKLAEQLDDSINGSANRKPISLNPVVGILRNLFFLIVVLFHGFRRLFPPY